MPEEIVRRVVRFDLDAKGRRAGPEGGIIVPARIARVGVLVYKNDDGTERRELRLPEDVFAKKSLDSFANATLTVRHPPSLVTPLNWRQYAAGHVGEVHQDTDDERFAKTDLHVKSPEAIRGLENGDLVECSNGYQCRLDRTSGVHETFGRYDAIQRDITGNHVAIGPKGWGRSGGDVRAHMDAADEGTWAEDVDRAPYVRDMRNKGAQGRTPTRTSNKPPVAQPREDEIEEEELEPEESGAPAPHADDASELRGENATLVAENKRLRREAAARNDAASKRAERERFDAALAEQVALIAVAQPILGEEWKHDGKSADEIRRDVLDELEPEVLELPEAQADAKDAEAFVRGAYTAAVRRDARARKSREDSVRASPGAGRADGRTPKRPTTTERASTGTGRSDGARAEEPETIQDHADAMTVAAKDAWKKKRADRRGSRR